MEGFRCGLEIHQQIGDKKLYCDCKADVRKGSPDFTFTRELRGVVGELGTVDVAAAFEEKQKKVHVYEGYYDTNCLVEMDEEPPHMINEECVKTTLQIAKLFHAKPIKRLQVMRKTIIDGSAVGGFQRTALIARNGYLETSKGKVRIPHIFLEEDSGTPSKKKDKEITWNISRLGIALVEITTDTDIQDPEHAKETAEKIGMFLRSVPGVKRGIGTIRQDVNLSTEKHPRVEIKGFQDIRSMHAAIEYEVKRQAKAKEHLYPHVRAPQKDGSTVFSRPLPGEARMYPETDLPVFDIDISVEDVETIVEKTEKLVQEFTIIKEIAKKLISQQKDNLFANIVRSTKAKPTFVADTLLSLKKEKTEEDLLALFKAVEKGTIAKENVENILSEDKPVTEVLKKFSMMSGAELETHVKNILARNKGAPVNALMGLVMKELRGKADGKKIAELVKKLTSETQ